MTYSPPKIIYLQVDQDPEVTWCVDRIDDSDVIYLRGDLSSGSSSGLLKEVEELRAKVKELEYLLSEQTGCAFD